MSWMCSSSCGTRAGSSTSSSAENVDLINRKCHDLKHQIAALRRISDRREREESIQALEQSVMIYDSVVKTGNDILDTVLTEKSLLCESRGITLTCVADGDCLDFMDGVDIYTIFGNALDNAIESVTPLDDPRSGPSPCRSSPGRGWCSSRWRTTTRAP